LIILAGNKTPDVDLKQSLSGVFVWLLWLNIPDTSKRDKLFVNRRCQLWARNEATNSIRKSFKEEAWW